MAAGLGASVGQARVTHTRWNFTVFGADITFFSLGLSISSVYTVIPLFVHHLTSNNEAVALIPAVRAAGLYVPTLLVASLVERQRHALPFILRVTILERVPYLLLALGALWLAGGNPGLLLLFLILMMFLATFGSGLTYPAWLDMIARTIPGNWIGRFFGFWTGLGGFFGIGGAAVAAALLGHFAFPLNFALCFLLTFGMFVISFVLLALGREPPRTMRRELVALDAAEREYGGGAGLRVELRATWALLRGDRGLLRLIGSNALMGIATMASALFAVAALRRGGLTDADVGVENTVLVVAMTGGYFLWGILGDRFGHRTILVFGSLCAALSAGVALWAHGFWAYALVFLLLGFNLAATSLAGFTFITEFGPAARRPTYIALAAVAYAPFAVGAPILGGFLADAWGYVPVFIISAVAGLAAMLAFQLLVPDPRSRAAQAEKQP
ncbi:MAG TPA: MFS transporter [Ktedonobacterales bacterium]|nr:MFS transporter [Ktedonobacterales bacterium]